MQLKAVYRIRGVKEVVKGAGKGTNVAEPGDIFVPFSDESAKSLLDERYAVKPSENHENVINKVGSAVAVQAEQLGEDQAIDLGVNKASEETDPENSANKPEPTGTKKTGTKKTAAKKPAAAPVKNEGLDDLGLGDDNGQDEVIE